MIVSTDPIAVHNHGITLRDAERFEEALAAFERAERLGSRAPETRVMQANVLVDLGRFDEAVERYHAVTEQFPAFLPAHLALSRFMHQIGRGAEALDSYARALTRVTDDPLLWAAAMDAAKALHRPETQLAWANGAETRFGKDALIRLHRAQALSSLGEDESAYAILDDLCAGMPDFHPAFMTLAHVLIRLGEWRRAEQAVVHAISIDQQDQSGWSLLSIIWRLLGDEREVELTDYERFIVPAKVEGVDWPALESNLATRHRMKAHPADQSLRGGTQTVGNLLSSPDPAIRLVARQIHIAVEKCLADLPRGAGHPFLGRNTGRIAFSGSWSVRLRDAGFHISHIHPEGWLSSALYVSLPDDMGGGDAGALAFGVPDAALRLDLGPRRVVKAQVGQLVLFPSYFWHGTLPFHSDQPRMTIAFDAVPA